ncbi:hypothetical protein [Lishizhenia sp.]|uniref:hypothetical protein n=1 Tax=Lishizhenia sp. TaxID=2497594 RepID=UPI00299D295C|nr:hypothetical protein [Lishizhenia sp.]MDX1445222.1 hypothetical protein [Lishizhenia sp.]
MVIKHLILVFLLLSSPLLSAQTLTDFTLSENTKTVTNKFKSNLVYKNTKYFVKEWKSKIIINGEESGKIKLKAIKKTPLNLENSIKHYHEIFENELYSIYIVRNSDYLYVYTHKTNLDNYQTTYSKIIKRIPHNQNEFKTNIEKKTSPITAKATYHISLVSMYTLDKPVSIFCDEKLKFLFKTKYNLLTEIRYLIKELNLDEYENNNIQFNNLIIDANLTQDNKHVLYRFYLISSDGYITNNNIFYLKNIETGEQKEFKAFRRLSRNSYITNSILMDTNSFVIFSFLKDEENNIFKQEVILHNLEFDITLKTQSDIKVNLSQLDVKNDKTVVSKLDLKGFYKKSEFEYFGIYNILDINYIITVGEKLNAHTDIEVKSNKLLLVTSNVSTDTTTSNFYALNSNKEKVDYNYLAPHYGFVPDISIFDNLSEFLIIITKTTSLNETVLPRFEAIELEFALINTKSFEITKKRILLKQPIQIDPYDPFELECNNIDSKSLEFCFNYNNESFHGFERETTSIEKTITLELK